MKIFTPLAACMYAIFYSNMLHTNKTFPDEILKCEYINHGLRKCRNSFQFMNNRNII